ncbi:hypothetical protein PthBH41_32360 [Parageobacillus thermoglucosidasius]|nr:hypothetical protein B4168_2491 [Anoxybacillus flavithermus]OAO85289.1 hypothetical protein GT23_2980 [Parageobacillus thermoglucosidasius]BDG33524.1 hypothetical protein PthBH41_32360 [Parageobacillus thermoglucosidasius]GAJ43049.1 hypothetical protein GT2_07_00320 [Parageobacillus thermoglucosidasius NBRC 107763]
MGGGIPAFAASLLNWQEEKRAIDTKSNTVYTVYIQYYFFYLEEMSDNDEYYYIQLIR